MNIRDCLEKGFLQKIGPDKKLIEKEFIESGAVVPGEKEGQVQDLLPHL